MSCETEALAMMSEGQGRAYAACRYFDAVDTNAKINLAIAGIQQVVGFYFADKQHDIAKQSANRMDDVWQFNKNIAEKQFKHWDENARPEELEQLQKASDREQAGYQVDYETAKNRALADVRGEFGRAREKLLRERKAHCVGANRHAHRQLNIAEARAAVAALNQAYRAEEQRKDLKEAQYREELYKWLGLFRGSVGDSLNASKSATAAAAARGQINPYAAWQQAFGGLTGLGHAFFNMNEAQAFSDMSRVYGSTSTFGMPTGNIGSMGNPMPSSNVDALF